MTWKMEKKNHVNSFQEVQSSMKKKSTLTDKIMQFLSVFRIGVNSRQTIVFQ